VAIIYSNHSGKKK